MKKEVYLILDNIRSRENVGSIFRTADAAGITKIYLCGITPVPSTGNHKPQNPNHKQILNSKLQTQGMDKIAKTALGAEKYVLWEYCKQTWRLLEKLKADGLQTTALEQTKNSINIFKFKAVAGRPLAVVVGNEVRGLSPKILKYCDEVVHIPMYGKKESLNVAVATGIATYQLIK